MMSISLLSLSSTFCLDSLGLILGKSLIATSSGCRWLAACTTPLSSARAACTTPNEPAGATGFPSREQVDSREAYAAGGHTQGAVWQQAFWGAQLAPRLLLRLVLLRQE